MEPTVTTKRLRKFGGTHIYSYDDQGVSNLALFQLLRSAGFELARFDITELHDRYDEFDAFTCSSFDELFSSAEWGRIGGNWLLSGVYGGCEVWLKGSNPPESLEVHCDAEHSKSISKLVEEIDAIAPNRVEVEHGVLTRCVGDCPKVNARVTSIAPKAFAYNRSVRAIVIRDGCEEIGDQAFHCCSNLEYLQIPGSVKKMGDQALFGCDKLTTAGPISKSPYAEWERRPEFSPRGYFTYNYEFGHTTELPDRLCYNMQHLASVVIPEGVTTIGRECFWNCKNLHKTTVPDTVTAIGKGAFAGCVSAAGTALPVGASLASDDAFKPFAPIKVPTPARPKRKEAPGPDAPTIVATNDYPDGEAARKVRAFSATHLPAAGEPRRGRLALGGGRLSFKGAGDPMGRPSVSVKIERGSLLLKGDVLEVMSEGVRHRFKIAEGDLHGIELHVLLIDDLCERVGSYASPIADSCASASWPGVRHPFFQAHAKDRTDVLALLGFLADDRTLNTFVFSPLPWLSGKISIRQTERQLLVNYKQGSELYAYIEDEDSIRLSYYTHQVGFFDDSEHEDEVTSTLRYVADPGKDVVAAAISTDEAGLSSQEPIYLLDPFGMPGVYELKRQ